MEDNHQHGSGGHHHHHILPDKVALGVGASLLALTFITVYVAGIDFGRFNFFIAMLIATVKASLVCLFFMNLLYDKRENGVIFVTSFLFLAIFIVFTASDLFFRGDVYVKKGAMAATSGGKAQFKKPWVSTPEIVAHGKELFAAQCTSCHGEQGLGNGVAAASLNPKPRNFHSAEGWKNGRKVTQVFGTLTKGVPGSAMASFATLSQEDRWSLAQFVLSLGPTPPAAEASDFAALGIDPNKEGGGAAEAAEVPVEFAIKRMIREAGSH